jgi:8-oxo-dGTP diphosphatase
MVSVRVYGILLNEQQQVLVSDEKIRGEFFTKFPGGGLEFGEGTRDCLAREFMEEMNLKVRVGEHIYTTDFFQMSAFNKAHQILSIYYYAHALETITAPIRTAPFVFDAAQDRQYTLTQEIESFRFIDMTNFGAHQVSLPIDKIVADQIRQGYKLNQ